MLVATFGLMTGGVGKSTKHHGVFIREGEH